ncbi:SpoIIE family protein phosphatase [Bdellovibrionota bacterium FG-1]
MNIEYLLNELSPSTLVMHLRYHTKLSVLIFLLVFLAVLGSAGFFVRFYVNEKLAAVYEHDLDNTTRVVDRAESLLASSAIFDANTVMRSKDVVLLVEQPCLAMAEHRNPVVMISDFFVKAFQYLDLPPLSLVWSPAFKTGCHSVQTSASPKIEFLPQPVRFQGPYLAALVKTPEKERVLVIDMDSLGGSTGKNSFYVTDQNGEVIWRNLENAADKDNNEAEIKRYLKQALATGGPGVVSGQSKQVIAFAPLLGDKMLFSFGLLEAAMNPVQFIVKQMLLLGGGFLFLCLVLGKVFAARISEPLSALRASAEKFGAGDLAFRAEVTGEEEIAVVQSTFNRMADRISQLIDDTKQGALMEAEIVTAQRVQQWFFPERKISIAGHEFHSSVQMAARCGGDWWGYIEVPAPKSGDKPLILVMIGDVTGHGISSALLTAATQGCTSILSKWLESSPEILRDPRNILRLFNQTVVESSGGELSMSFFAAVLDPNTDTLVAANAGHNWPYLISSSQDSKDKPNQSVVSAIATPGPVLGDPKAEFMDLVTRPWRNGDQLFLFTDGLVELIREGQPSFDRRRLSKTLLKNSQLSSRLLLEKVLSERALLTVGMPAEDDVTVVLCSRAMQ